MTYNVPAHYLFKRDFLQGYIQKFASKHFKMTPLLQKKVINEDTFTKIKDKMTVDEEIEKGRIHLPRPMVNNAEFESVKTEFYKTESGAIASMGYRIQISEKEMKRDPVGTVDGGMRQMRKLAYLMSRIIEREAYLNIKENAGIKNPTTSSKLFGAGETVDVANALLDLGVAFDIDSLPDQELNVIFGDKVDLASIRKHLNKNEIVTQNRDIRGWKPASGFEYADTLFTKGSRDMRGNSEIFGFAGTESIGNIFYAREVGATTPAVEAIEDQKQFAPLINVTVKEPDRVKMEDLYTINMKLNMGIDITDPEKILYANNLKAV